jgi:hypothetical protein
MIWAFVLSKLIALHIKGFGTFKLRDVITNTSHQRFNATEFVYLGRMANASFAKVVNLALPNCRLRKWIVVNLEYLDTQIAQFGDGIDFDYLRTVVLLIGDEFRIASMSMVPSAFIQAWKCGKLNNCKIDETRR